jgi:Uma2 family endonuclease
MTKLMPTMPQTLPVSVDQYRLLVEHGTFADRRGRVELIYGKIVEMNPQGPEHADPIDELGNWSHHYAGDLFRIRIEKPIEVPGLNSSPEPDIAWVTKRRYADRHPLPEEVFLLIEVSGNSKVFDGGEKRRLYAEAGIAEYWIVDIVAKTVEVMTQPVGSEFAHSVLYDVTAQVSPKCLPSAVLPITQLFSNTVD